MARKCFYSFHYKPDNWRVSKIRNIGVVEGNKPASDNDWETITGGGGKKIKRSSERIREISCRGGYSRTGEENQRNCSRV